MKKVLTISLFACIFLLPACGDDSEEAMKLCPGGIEAVVRNLSDQSGCGWLMEKKDGEFLTIVNFADFDIPIQNGKSYLIIYVQLLNTPLSCKNSKLAQLSCIAAL